MPPEASPRNRGEPKRETSEHVARWRGSPSYHGGSRSFHRHAEPRRPFGHSKQDDWHIYPRETGLRYAPHRSYTKVIPVREDDRYSRGYRDERWWREHRGRQSWEEVNRRPSYVMPRPSEDSYSMRDQHEKRSDANQMSPSQKFDKRFHDSPEWRARRWVNRGSFSTRGLDPDHSSGPKRPRDIDLVEKMVESEKKPSIALKSSTENVTECLYTDGQSDELTAKKKPRLAWGEGLAKYEKKKVEGCDEKLLNRGTQSGQSLCSEAIDRNLGVLGVLDGSSTATAYSSLVPMTVTEGRLSDSMKRGCQVDGLSDLSNAQRVHEGHPINFDKLDISFENVGPSLVQLLQSNDMSVDSTLLSTSMDDLVLMKEKFSKVLLMTESEIDSLENELRTISSDAEHVCSYPVSSSFRANDSVGCTAGMGDITKEISLPMVSQDASPRTVPPFEHMKLLGGLEISLCNQIFSLNNQAASRASAEVFSKLIMGDHDELVPVKSTRWQDDLGIQEKFTQRKQFLLFKERVLALKYKIFHRLWQKDVSSSSMLKSQNKRVLRLRVRMGGSQKPKPLIRPHASSPGTMGPFPSKQIVRYTGKLVEDSCWRVYREDLKMPALELDEKGRTAGRFLSYNGLVEDPCAVEKERTLINPWTLVERKMFLDKLEKYGKDFRKIATFLKHKTTADCIEFYYKNHKSDFFLGLKKTVGNKVRPQKLPAKPYLVTSGRVRICNANTVSPDVLNGSLIETSLCQAKAGDDELSRESCPQNFLLRPCSRKARSSSTGAPEDDRDAIAADVLTELRSSVVDFESSKAKGLSDWTDEEKSVFMQAVSCYGKDFALISKFVKTRSSDQCRAFYNKARRCLGLDSMLPRPVLVGKPLSFDVSGRGDVENGRSLMRTATICNDGNSSTHKDWEFPVSVKTEAAESFHCDLPTDWKEAFNGSHVMDSCFSEGQPGSVKDHDVLLGIKLDDQVTHRSPRASGRQSAELSPCSVFSVGSESKDQSPVEVDQIEKPQRATDTCSASSESVETKTPEVNHPERQEQSSCDSEGKVDNLQELGKCSHGRDFKLFGKRILAYTPSPRSPESDLHSEHKKEVIKPVQYLGIDRCSEGQNSSLHTFDPNDQSGLENVPIRSYGYWDGTSVVPSLPDSALLLAKYPAAFSKHPLLEVARSSLSNFNNSMGPSIIPAWDGTLRQHGNACIQIQRCNSLEAICGLKQVGIDGMNFGAAGVLAGVACNNLSYPVKMQNATANQFQGQGTGLNREDSLRDAAGTKT